MYLNNIINNSMDLNELKKLLDFEDIKKSFQLIEYIENQDDRGFFVTYIFQKIKT